MKIWALPLFQNRRNVWRDGWCLGIFILLLLMPLLSLGVGITWDEWMDSNNGLLGLQYLLSAGHSSAFLDFWHGYLYSHLFFAITGLVYGGLFDSLPSFVDSGLMRDENLLPFYTMSHAINAVFGLIAILFTGLTAKEAGKWRTAFLSLLILALSPGFIGHSMNNPKDIPFAATSIAALYGILRFLKEIPNPRKITVACLALAFALALGTRIAAVMLMVYFSVFVLALAFRHLKSRPRNVAKTFVLAAAAMIVGYWAGLFFWPYGQIHPLTNIFIAVKQLSEFKFDGGMVLFNGREIDSMNLPWTYLPTWILITCPLGAVFGWFLFGFFFAKKQARTASAYLLLTAVFFPVLFAIVKKSTIYDGWRHFLFIYPPLVVLAALGWDFFLDTFGKHMRAKFIPWLLFAFLAMDPASWLLSAFPYYSVYFNPLTGGLKGALGRFETDYWGNSLREAAEWLGHYHLSHAPDQAAWVRADGHPMQTYPYLKAILGSRYFPYNYPDDYRRSKKSLFVSVPYEKHLAGADGWDYAIVLTRGWSPEALRQGRFPPPGTLHEIRVRGVPLCAVVKNPRMKAS